MSEVLQWPGTDLQGVLARAAAALHDGQVVIFPSELGYEGLASALHAPAIEVLQAMPQREGPLAIGLGHAAEAFDWLPFLRGAALRFIRRLWPGPLCLVSDTGWPWGVARHLPRAVREQLKFEQDLTLRHPSHPGMRDLLGALGQAAVCTPLADLPELTSKEAMVFKDSNPSPKQSATVLFTRGREWRVLQAGHVAESEIAAVAPCRIVFVCTGNTCRSPLAEALCRNLLSQRLGCAAADLPAQGFVVASAGLAAQAGAPAAADAIEVAQRMGGDLSKHRSQPLSAELLLDADFIFTMTYSHLRMLQGLRLTAGARLLSSRDEEIDDPLGGAATDYERCARQIEAELVELIPEILEG